MAVFTFKHAFVGKASSEPGTASAHVNYISRKSATCYQEAVGFASKPRQTHANATWRFLQEREVSIRKNGRVCDKFIIAVPVEMKQEEAIGTLRRFGQRIGCRHDGDRLLKAPFFFTLQDWGTHNPHAHFVFVDADRESGERVFGTTRKGSTDRLRAAWEETCNAELERLGYEARIDRRPQRVIDEELSATVAGPDEVSPEVHTDGLPSGTEELGRDWAGTQSATPPDAPTEKLPEELEQAQESSNFPEDDMAEVVKPYTANENGPNELAIVQGNDGERYFQDDRLREWRHVDHPERRYGFDDAESIPIFAEETATIKPQDEGRVVAGKEPYSVAGRVNRFTQLHARLTELQSAQQKLRDLQTAYEQHKTAYRTHERDLEKALSVRDTRSADADLAEAELKMYHQTRSGRLKGFNVLGWKVLGRKEAEAAQLVAQTAAMKHSRAARDAELQSSVTRQAWDTANETSKDLQKYEATLAAEQRFGTRAQMIESEKVLQRSEEAALKGLSGAQVYEAMERGEITEEEALDACRALGDAHYVEMIEEQLEHERER